MTRPRAAKATPATIPLRRPATKQTTDADRLVGLRIAALRKGKKMSQTALGEAIGVTFQQVQKYEKGANRVGAGRLQEIAQLFEVPVSALFAQDDALDGGAQALAFLRVSGAMDLLRAYASICDAGVRQGVLALVAALANSGSEP